MKNVKILIQIQTNKRIKGAKKRKIIQKIHNFEECKISKQKLIYNEM